MDANPDASSQPDGDVGEPDACTAETDQAICARLAACDTVSTTDTCGTTRTVDCGGCAGGDACVASTCEPAQCDSFAFANQIVLPDFSAPTEQDAIAATTPDGETMLLQRRAFCAGPFSLFLVDGVGTTNVGSDLSSAPGLAGMRSDAENNLALTADGLTIIGVSDDGTRLLASTRSGLNATDFPTAAPGDYAAIALAAPSAMIGPAISADGLALYYTVVASADPSEDGIYEAVRSSPSAAFPAGTRMAGDVQGLQYVTATSEDRMTLFVQTNNFSMVVLTRTSLGAPFTNPNAPAEPPTVPGFRTRPIAGCDRLVGTCGGGCTNEETCVFTM